MITNDRIVKAFDSQTGAEVNIQDESLVFFSLARLQGLFDVSPVTLKKMDLPFVDLLGNGKKLVCSLSDLRKWVDERRGK